MRQCIVWWLIRAAEIPLFKNKKRIRNPRIKPKCKLKSRMFVKPDSTRVFFISGVVISDEVHHLDEDVLAVHQLVVVPLTGVLAHVLLHQIGVALFVEGLAIMMLSEQLEIFYFWWFETCCN